MRWSLLSFWRAWFRRIDFFGSVRVAYVDEVRALSEIEIARVSSSSMHSAEQTHAESKDSSPRGSSHLRHAGDAVVSNHYCLLSLSSVDVCYAMFHTSIWYLVFEDGCQQGGLFFFVGRAHVMFRQFWRGFSLKGPGWYSQITYFVVQTAWRGATNTRGTLRAGAWQNSRKSTRCIVHRTHVGRCM